MIRFPISFVTSYRFECTLRNNNWSGTQGLLSSYVSSVSLSSSKSCVATTVTSQNLLLAFCALRSFPFFLSVLLSIGALLSKNKISFRNKSSWLVPRYTSKQPCDNVHVLQGSRRGHDYGEQTSLEPEPDPDSGSGPGPGSDSEYGQSPRNCRGSSSRGPR